MPTPTPDEKPLLGPIDAGMVREWEQNFRRHVLGQHTRPPNQIPAIGSQDIAADAPSLVYTSGRDGVQRWLYTCHQRFLEWVGRQRLGTYVLDYRLTLDGLSVRIAMRAVQLFTARWRHQQRGTEYLSLGVALVQSGKPIFEGERLMVYVDPESGQLWARPESEFRDGRFTEVS